MTAEYSLLPASTGERTDREAARGKQGGRTVEIQRLIGRALRGVVDFQALGERTVYLDCDVLQADGGTRCAAITGAYVAAWRALDKFGLSKALTGSVAAVSVGVVEGVARLGALHDRLGVRLPRVPDTRRHCGPGRPDAHRSTDRDGDRVPRRGRDHPRGALGARAHDRGDSLGRRGDRHGERRGVLLARR